MAASTAAFASGDAGSGVNYSRAEDERKLSGRKRRTVWLSQQPRPLFVAETDFRSAKHFTRTKKALLVLFGGDVHVVDVAALDADDSATPDMSFAVLRWINYLELLEVSLVGACTLKIEFGDPKDRPKVTGSVVLDQLSSTAGTASDSLATHSAHALSDAASTSSFGSPAPGSTATGSSAAASPAAMRVTYDSFTLGFKDEATAQQAAAALMYHRAQYAAARQWLYQGLHAGFKCELIQLLAQPLSPAHSDKPFPDRRTSAGMMESRGGAASAAPAPPGFSQQQQPAPYPWASSSGCAAPTWGCCVPLPASWGGFLHAAAEQLPADERAADSQPDICLEDLSCPVDLLAGPQALQVQFSTPLGVAVACVTPQLVRAAMLNSSCREVLAVPLHAPAKHHGSGKGAHAAGFSWRVTSRIPADPAAGEPSRAGSASDLAAPSGLAGYPDLSEPITEHSAAAAAAAAGAAGVHLTDHRVEAHAYLMIEVLHTPHTAGKRGAARVFSPDAAAAAAAAARAASSIAGAPAARAGGHGHGHGGTHSGASPGVAGLLLSPSHLLLLQLALAALVACLQLSGAPLLAMLQLSVVAVVAGLQFPQLAAALGSTLGLGQHNQHQHLQARHRDDLGLFSYSAGGIRSAAPSAAGAAPSHAGAAAAAAGAAGGCCGDSADVTACGWSLRLVCGDVVAAPSRHLQLQVSMARADKGLTRLRQRIASISSAGGVLPQQQQLVQAVTDEVLLVSSPEPDWLTPDVKQRFLNAKTTLEASREAARRTHKWRQRMEVDQVLAVPAPGFDAVFGALPTYVLADESPEGHAVMVMKAGGLKTLCDAVFHPPTGAAGLSMHQVEHVLALLNEYLVHVSAPKPLPAGYQVQIYDLEGFKLGNAMGDMMTLFKMLVRFGHYYPERLHQALVINAPAWFSYPWKLMSGVLDANTSAKVVVVGAPKAALSVIAHHMGGVEHVPAAWGGKCGLPLQEYPAHKRMMEYVRRLNTPGEAD